MINNVMDTKNDDGAKRLTLDEIMDASQNVAVLLDDIQLDAIANQVIEDFKLDRESMTDWLADMEQAVELASQSIKVKSEPWQNAANIKHALILEACIQFNARAYPEIIRDDKVVKTKVLGADVDGAKRARAERVDTFMNAQLMHLDLNWEEDLDRLLMTLAMMGTVYKKTYFDLETKLSTSMMCLPDKVTIHQSTKSLRTARRITHEIELYPLDVESRIRQHWFLDQKLVEVTDDTQPTNDQPLIFLEQMRYLDLDKDGYAEPYAVTVHEISRKVVRITPCFNDSTVTYGTDDRDNVEVKQIVRIDYFADFHFIHAIDGTFLSYGFGYLLSHATSTINGLLNQLVDSGTLNNLQSGWVGRGARLPGGDQRFRPGEWKQSDSSGAVLKDNIVPLPTKEPSSTLFGLVQFLLTSYYRMISLSDIMSGQISGSNTTAAEAMQAAEQGMKVMNSVYKRIYRGLRKEFTQLYMLNFEHLSDSYYSDVIEVEGASVVEDFATEGLNVLPVADANMGTQLEEAMRLKMVLELSQAIPEINRVALGRRFLRAQRIENIDELLPAVDPNQPTPQQQEMQKQLEAQAQQLQAVERELQVKEGEFQLKAAKLDLEMLKLYSESVLIQSKAKSEGEKVQIEAFMAQVNRLREEANMIQALTPDRNQPARKTSNDENSSGEPV